MNATLSRSARALAGRRNRRAPARPTMADVAREAGVSVMTVSRVINGGSASGAAKAAVRQAVARLGFRPNDAARKLAAARSAQARRTDPLPVDFPNPWAPYGRMLSQLLDRAS